MLCKPTTEIKQQDQCLWCILCKHADNINMENKRYIAIQMLKKKN